MKIKSPFLPMTSAFFIFLATLSWSHASQAQQQSTDLVEICQSLNKIGQEAYQTSQNKKKPDPKSTIGCWRFSEGTSDDKSQFYSTGNFTKDLEKAKHGAAIEEGLVFTTFSNQSQTLYKCTGIATNHKGKRKGYLNDLFIKVTHKQTPNTIELNSIKFINSSNGAFSKYVRDDGRFLHYLNTLSTQEKVAFQFMPNPPSPTGCLFPYPSNTEPKDVNNPIRNGLK
jgi:hypothetical protein